MSRLISDLLGAKEPLFSLAIKQLESIAGKPAIDVRLTAEIISQVKAKTKQLGLDPSDTTPQELYHCLIAKIKRDDELIADRIGVTKDSTPKTAIPLIVKAVNVQKVNRKCWVLKKSVAKELLIESPPKKVMSHLKYKSIASMVKNENIYELYGALRFAESPSWLKKFNSSLKNIIPSDFEERKIEIYEMPYERWADLSSTFIIKKRHNISHLKEIGVVIVLPISNNSVSGLSITVLPLILHYINEIRLYSSFFKLNQVKPDFSKIISDTLNNDGSHAAKMAGQEIHWRVIQRYWGKQNNTIEHPEIFEPHIQPEDLFWRKAEQILFDIEPILNWWENLDFVGVLGDELPVTFNLMDNAISYANRFDYADRAIYHFRDSLWNELFTRYLGEKALQQQILSQLDGTDISPKSVTSKLHNKGI
ncbi:MAG: hypothetical protein WCP03_02390 [Candidatus Saccharibacteria bacterium]